MGQEISAIEQAAPYIVITGVAGDENAQFYVYAEQQIVVESSTMRDAVLDLVASYFVFDISYPKSLSAILIFIQHQIFVMGDSQSIPIAAAKLMGNIKKLNN